MKEWVFVHNERDEKQSTETLLSLVDFRARAGTVRIGNHIGKSELWEIVRTLEPRIIHDSLGFPRLPNAGAIERLSMADLQPVL